MGDYKKIPNAKITKGNICATEYAGSSDGHSRYYAHIQYFVEGKEYYTRTKTTASVGFYKGRKMLVKYNSEDPTQAMHVHSLKDYILGPGIFIIFGIYIILSEVLYILPSIFN